MPELGLDICPLVAWLKLTLTASGREVSTVSETGRGEEVRVWPGPRPGRKHSLRG